MIACTPKAAPTVATPLIRVSLVSTCLSITRARFVVRLVDKIGNLRRLQSGKMCQLKHVRVSVPVGLLMASLPLTIIRPKGAYPILTRTGAGAKNDAFFGVM